MRHVLAFLLVILVGLSGPAAAERPSDAVDPFIGTGGHGHTYPGATMPFGMVQLSPDTRLEGWDGCSGYHFSDEIVYGFSHTHLSGTGVSDYGDILLMPITGSIQLENGYPSSPDAGYASRFAKQSERAGAGWYSVHLADYGIDVDLTATRRAGIHRYRFPPGQPAHVVIDLEHRDQVLASELRVVSDREIEGHRRSTAWATDQVVYFVARFSRPILQTYLTENGGAGPGASEAKGGSVKAALSFGDDAGELIVQVGISAVDVEGARRNLDAEATGHEFETLRENARSAWDATIGRVEIEGATDAQRTIFTTALYHSLLAPNLYSDVDGRYRGMDLQVHEADGREHYTVFSLWDTFRATHPLLTILEPRRTAEFVQTFLAQYQQGGRLPVWELAANETECMIGYHSVSVIADAYLKGIRDFDAELALEAMVHSATLDHFGLEAYQELGFIPADRESESVSKTLEYAYDDWCIARMAEAMGREDVAERFFARSQAWRHLLDPQTLQMRPRLNQRWLTPFDPRRVDFNYTEANAWQYRFAVPHDVEGLIDAMGGDESFVARLDSLFTVDSQTTGREQADITGLIGQYAHGNEPSHHKAWLYHYAGRPDRSAERVRQILDTLYAPAPDGLSGNEDCGQMSSWYVLSSLGLYPVAPGSNEYLLAPPLFARATVELTEGRSFTIRAEGPRAGTVYLRAARLNGTELSRSFLRHEEIMRGGELVLELGREPSTRWGREPRQRPRSRVEGPRVLAAPYLVAPGESFREPIEVELRSASNGALVYYSTDSNRPRDQWERFADPLRLEETTTLTFQAVDGERSSPVVSATLHRIPHDWSIDVRSTPNSQYTAGGPLALLDGRRGPDDWRTGAWQGYQDQDFEAVVDFGAPRELSRVGASFLQDARSWIWMPVELIVSVSLDGETFREIARIGHDVPDDELGVTRRDFAQEIQRTRARYLRVFARNYGTIPDWHPGAGGEAFIFVDEIIVR